MTLHQSVQLLKTHTHSPTPKTNLILLIPTASTITLRFSSYPTNMGKASTKPSKIGTKHTGAPSKPPSTLTSLGKISGTTSKQAKKKVTLPNGPVLEDSKAELDMFKDPEPLEEGKNQENPSSPANTADMDTSFESTESSKLPNTNQFIKEHINISKEPEVPTTKNTVPLNEPTKSHSASLVKKSLRSWL